MQAGKRDHMRKTCAAQMIGICCRETGTISGSQCAPESSLPLRPLLPIYRAQLLCKRFGIITEWSMFGRCYHNTKFFVGTR